MQAGGVNLGDVDLGETLYAALVITDADGTPKDPAVLPTFRVYGEGPGPMANGLGSLSKFDGGTVTAASNATPIVVTTSTPHNLQTGDAVTVSGVLGNTAANGDFAVTVISPTTFSLNSSSGNGPYTSGGAWHVTGLYLLTLSATAGNGYEAGVSYRALVNWTISGDNFACMNPFRVT